MQSNRKGISEFVKCAYLAYFKVVLGDQNKAHGRPTLYASKVYSGQKNNRKSFRFGIPMIWREPKKHFDECYFCAVNTKAINRKNRNSSVYPNLESAIRLIPSAIRLIPHCNKISVSVFEGLPELELPGSQEDQASVLSTDISEDTISDVGFPPSLLPQLFSQGELNDLT